jgi:hypothetical protein
MGIGGENRVLLAPSNHGDEPAPPGDGRTDKGYVDPQVVTDLPVVQVQSEEASALGGKKGALPLERDEDLACA